MSYNPAAKMCKKICHTFLLRQSHSGGELYIIYFLMGVIPPSEVFLRVQPVLDFLTLASALLLHSRGGLFAWQPNESCGSRALMPEWVLWVSGSLVISKGLETPAGTWVRVRKKGVRVRNVRPHINPYP